MNQLDGLESLFFGSLPESRGGGWWRPPRERTTALRSGPLSPGPRPWREGLPPPDRPGTS